MSFVSNVHLSILQKDQIKEIALNGNVYDF